MNDFKQLKDKCAREWAALAGATTPVIYIGTASCGRASGALKIRAGVEEVLARRGWSAAVVEVGCVGACYLEPMMDVAMPGGPRFSYGNVHPAWVEGILQSHFLEGKPFASRVLGHFGEGEVEGVPRVFDLPMFAPQVRIVLKNCGFIDPDNIHHYIANGGYEGFHKALQRPPSEVIAEVETAGLRGRGGAGFPTGKKWRFCSESKGDGKYIICNADEGDPGAFMNRSLIEGDPHAVLEGMLIAGYAIGASQGVVYIRAEYPLAIERLNKAMAQMRAEGLLGEGILGSPFGFDIRIKEGAGAFVCGEETALIASIEGRRGMPRTRPPFPVQEGLHGKPTVINNVETLGTVPHILRRGAAWYRGFGTLDSPGTKTFSLVGKIRRTGLIEIPLGMTLRRIIFDIGGGTQKPFKAVQTGGPSGGCLSEEFLDTPVGYETLAKAGSIMGSGGLIVMDADTCVVDIARYFLDFIQKESCGKCTPCRVGTRHMVEILERITGGEGEPRDLDKLHLLAQTVKQTSLCGLGQTAPNPVLTTLAYFRNDYVEHIRDRYCSAVVCRPLLEYFIIPDRCTGCQRCVAACPTGAIAGPRSEPHNLDASKCIKCRSCYEICRFEAIAGNAIQIRSKG